MQGHGDLRMRFDIKRHSKIDESSFRVAAVKGRFDLEVEKIQEHFEGEILIPENWQIGVIYGGSGTGKTTIAKEMFGNEYVSIHDYSAGSVVDDMPTGKTVEDITKMFVSVGFGSTPSWLKPYSVLSNGEKMRVDLARALLSRQDLIVFDEFTSVVDRHIAKIGSMCVSKAVRRSDKQFVAVSCHDDILEWLEPDWTFCTDTMTMIDIKKKDHRSSLRYSSAIEKRGDCLAAITI
jgi:ABC-type dipeptide/oligopeptide/nickel transport system ATPase subunit